MAKRICKACGVQYKNSHSACLICEDDRQYVPESGQAWTTLADLRRDHQNEIESLEPGLFAIKTTPGFGIGQRGLLLQSAAGNILWDCISLVDDATLEKVQRLGGISMMAISHPHFFGSMVDWSRMFGNVPIYLHEDNRPWVVDDCEHIVYWDGGQRPLTSNITLVHCGGHFSGSTVLHWADGADGAGALLCGDTLHPVPNRPNVSFMHSFPNALPLPASKVRKIGEALEPYTFDRIYGGWGYTIVKTDAKKGVQNSVERYIQAIQEK